MLCAVWCGLPLVLIADPRAHMQVSDFANAKAWARRAWEVACVTAGPESAAARTFKMYWANPRAHRFAGLLPRGVLGGPDSS